MNSAVDISSIKREVYQATKDIFIDEKAQFRKPKLVRRTVDNHAGEGSLVRHLMDQHGAESIYQTVLELLSGRVYQSSQIASCHFPELFEPSAAQSESRVQLEAEAARTEQAAIEDIVRTPSIDNQGALDLGDTSLSLRDWLNQYGTNNRTNKPQLFPAYLPFPTEHLLMERLQKVLELACYEFGAKALPDIVQKRGWDCPESAELHHWTHLLKREEVLEWTSTNKTLDELLRSIASIRHTAVHRLRTNSAGLERFLLDAEELVVVLGDVEHVEAISRLRSIAELVLTELTQSKQFLQLQLETTQEGIAKQRMELDRKEQEAIDHMMEEDQKYMKLAGEKLEKALKLRTYLRVNQDGEKALMNGLSDIEDEQDNDHGDKGDDGDEEDCDDDDMDMFEDCDEPSSI